MRNVTGKLQRKPRFNRGYRKTWCSISRQNRPRLRPCVRCGPKGDSQTCGRERDRGGPYELKRHRRYPMQPTPGLKTRLVFPSAAGRQRATQRPLAGGAGAGRDRPAGDRARVSGTRSTTLPGSRRSLMPPPRPWPVVLVPIRYLFRGVSRRFTTPRQPGNQGRDEIAIGTCRLRP